MKILRAAVVGNDSDYVIAQYCYPETAIPTTKRRLRRSIRDLNDNQPAVNNAAIATQTMTAETTMLPRLDSLPPHQPPLARHQSLMRPGTVATAHPHAMSTLPCSSFSHYVGARSGNARVTAAVRLGTCSLA